MSITATRAPIGVGGYLRDLLEHPPDPVVRSEDDKPADGGLGPVARRLAADVRVLAIEDEIDIAHFLRAYFRASGYDLVHVDPEDVDQALAACDEHEPDLVMLDLRLRGFRGEEIYRALRSDERWAFTPIVVVSAEPFDHQDEGGLDAYVSKPFNTDALAELVGQRIERARALAEVGRDETVGTMSEEYLRARLIDEVAAGREHGTPCTFALVQLRSMDKILASIGWEATHSFLTNVLDKARRDLPTTAVIGSTAANEIAVIMPGVPVEDGAALLERVMGQAAGIHQLKGGATFEVVLAAGIAGYPDNAADHDELYMAADAALDDAKAGRDGFSRAL